MSVDSSNITFLIPDSFFLSLSLSRQAGLKFINFIDLVKKQLSFH